MLEKAVLKREVSQEKPQKTKLVLDLAGLMLYAFNASTEEVEARVQNQPGLHSILQYSQDTCLKTKTKTGLTISKPFSSKA